MNLTETYVPKTKLHVQQLAIAVAEEQKKTIQIKDKAVLTVSGGRSPIAFHALSQQRLAWENVVITLVDERLTATDHSDSNTSLVRESLLINYARLSLSLKAILQAYSVFVTIGGKNKIAVYQQAKSEKKCYPADKLHFAPKQNVHQGILS